MLPQIVPTFFIALAHLLRVLRLQDVASRNSVVASRGIFLALSDYNLVVEFGVKPLRRACGNSCLQEQGKLSLMTGSLCESKYGASCFAECVQYYRHTKKRDVKFIIRYIWGCVLHLETNVRVLIVEME